MDSMPLMDEDFCDDSGDNNNLILIRNNPDLLNINFHSKRYSNDSDDSSSSSSSNDDEITTLMKKARSQESVFSAGGSISLENLMEQMPKVVFPPESSQQQQGLFRELLQTQLAFWTFSLSIVVTYLWQKRASLRALVFAFFLSGASVIASMVLIVTVVAAHIFHYSPGISALFLPDEPAVAEQRVAASADTSAACSVRSSPRLSLSGASGRRASNFDADSQCSSASSTSSSSASSSQGSARGCGHQLAKTRYWQRRVATGAANYGRVLRPAVA